MEPSPLSDGNCVLVGTTNDEAELLQWSRRLSATETEDIQAVGEAIGDNASMEPSPLSDGNMELSVGSRVHRTGLQWSRRLSATETATPRGSSGRRGSFNGAVAS